MLSVQSTKQNSSEFLVSIKYVIISPIISLKLSLRTKII